MSKYSRFLEQGTLLQKLFKKNNLDSFFVQKGNKDLNLLNVKRIFHTGICVRYQHYNWHLLHRRTYTMGRVPKYTLRPWYPSVQLESVGCSSSVRWTLMDQLVQHKSIRRVWKASTGRIPTHAPTGRKLSCVHRALSRRCAQWALVEMRPLDGFS